jgi:serine/threonine-protein kinase
LSGAALSHPNIVSVYDRGQEAGTSYIAMEYVPGGTLKERISRGRPLEAGAATSVALQIAEALHVAHQRGVIHRDIKPHNVLISESGGAKVTDFGIARAAAATTATRTGRVLGTAGYMSPEQALGQRVDQRTDLYSLGVVLFEMLTGSLPFQGESPITVSMKHVNESPPSPSGIRPDLPGGVNALVLKLLAKNPEDRYADSWDLIEDLRRMRAGLPLAVALPPSGANGGVPTTQPNVPVLPPTRRFVHDASVRRRRRRRLVPWLLLALLALALIPLGIIALRGIGGNDIGGNNSGGDNRQPPIAGKVKVPDVRDMLQQRAEAKLERAGLEVGIIARSKSDRIEPSRVIAPGYPVGKRLDRGTAVNLTVSSGPSVAPTSSASSSAMSSATSSASSSASSQPTGRSTTPASSSASSSASPQSQEGATNGVREVAKNAEKAREERAEKLEEAREERAKRIEEQRKEAEGED